MDLGGDGKRLVGGSGEPEEGAEELGMADEDSGTGGGQPKDLRGVFQGGETGGADFRVRDVCAEPLHGTGPWKFSTWGCTADNGDTAKETGGGGAGNSFLWQ